MMTKSFLAGGLCLRFDCGETIGDADFFPLFRTAEDHTPDLAVHVIRAPLPQPDGITVFQTNHRSRRIADGTVYEYTYYSDAALLAHIPYACAVRHGADLQLYVDYNGPLWDTMLFDAVGLPDFFLANAAAIVHTSFIGVGADGILFAGPKQQGKSTQARLWNIYRDALVINGDRAAVCETESGFRAFSVPFCGSSRICVNTSRPIRAIVFPEKGTENAVTLLTPRESFRRLIGCITYTKEDAAASNSALLLAERIVSGIPCFRLCCRPDEGAVRALEEALGVE